MRALLSRFWPAHFGWCAALVLGYLLVPVNPARAVEPGDLLPPSAAFQVEAVRGANHTAFVTFIIAPGYALYRDRIHITSTDGNITSVTLPHGLVEHDAYLGAREQWRMRAIATVGLGRSDQPVHLHIALQGCADIGVCFNPETRELVF